MVCSQLNNTINKKFYYGVRQPSQAGNCLSVRVTHISAALEQERDSSQMGHKSISHTYTQTLRLSPAPQSCKTVMAPYAPQCWPNIT